MKITKTLQFEIIDANKSKLDKLNNTVRQYRKCINFYLHEIGKNPEAISNKNLPDIYKKAKNIYNLPTALLQTAGRKAIESYKSYKNSTKNKTYPHFDSFVPVRYDKRTVSTFQSTGKYKFWVSLSTTGKRVKVPITSSEDIINKWESLDYNFLAMELIYRGGRYFFNIIVQKQADIPKEEEFEHIVGVDMGVNNIASITVTDTSGNQLEHRIFSGKLLQEKKRRFHIKRKEYGEKNLKNKLRDKKRKEYNYTKDVNHKISREIVDIATKYSNCCIVMERLKGIRDKIRYTKHMNRKLHGWSFKQLQDFIIYKAHENGIAIRRVSPMYTSQVCTDCYSKSIKRSSQNASIGVCESCKKGVNSVDLQASVNIIKRLFFYMESNLGHSESGPNPGNKYKGFTEANQYGFVEQLSTV
ncbi:MAG: RNA-guided endonuclease TnpB family protein [Elusimicrobiota bacterium]